MARQVGLDGDKVVARWLDPAAKDATAQAFRRARSLGVTTYPSLFIDVGNALVPVLAGWAGADEIVAGLDAAIAA